MGYDSDRPPNTGSLNSMNILAVDQDTARSGIIEFVEKAEYCRFSTAGWSDYCHFGTSRNCEVEVFEDEPLRMISEIDIFEADGTTVER